MGDRTSVQYVGGKCFSAIGSYGCTSVQILVTWTDGASLNSSAIVNQDRSTRGTARGRAPFRFGLVSLLSLRPSEAQMVATGLSSSILLPCRWHAARREKLSAHVPAPATRLCEQPELCHILDPLAKSLRVLLILGKSSHLCPKLAHGAVATLPQRRRSRLESLLPKRNQMLEQPHDGVSPTHIRHPGLQPRRLQPPLSSLTTPGRLSSFSATTPAPPRRPPPPRAVLLFADQARRLSTSAPTLSTERGPARSAACTPASGARRCALVLLQSRQRTCECAPPVRIARSIVGWGLRRSRSGGRKWLARVGRGEGQLQVVHGGRRGSCAGEGRGWRPPIRRRRPRRPRRCPLAVVHLRVTVHRHLPSTAGDVVVVLCA